MKIAIDLTSLSFHMSGIERYAACVTEEMLKNDFQNEFILIFRNEVYHTFSRYIDNKRIRAVLLKGNTKLFFFQFILPYNLYKIEADKYLFFAFTAPVFFIKKGIINTIHDMGAWDSSESMTFFQKLYWRTLYRFASEFSEKIITVSEFSKGRINSILKYPNDKIYVVYSAVYEGVIKDYGYTFYEVKEKYNLPSKYIMTLSTLEPRKNLELLLKAFSSIQDKVDFDLVLVGRKGWKMDEVLEKYNSKNRIHITGFVDDKHVSLIYKNAECFIFPSLYEGFGLPPVEALALGTPVVASDAASIPEILRHQALYFRNNNLAELEELLLNFDSATMPCELDEYQKSSYRFDVSAKKILSIING